jgi:hypothetical protein
MRRVFCCCRESSIAVLAFTRGFGFVMVPVINMAIRRAPSKLGTSRCRETKLSIVNLTNAISVLNMEHCIQTTTKAVQSTQDLAHQEDPILGSIAGWNTIGDIEAAPRYDGDGPRLQGSTVTWIEPLNRIRGAIGQAHHVDPRCIRRTATLQHECFSIGTFQDPVATTRGNANRIVTLHGPEWYRVVRKKLESETRLSPHVGPATKVLTRQIRVGEAVAKVILHSRPTSLRQQEATVE